MTPSARPEATTGRPAARAVAPRAFVARALAARALTAWAFSGPLLLLGAALERLGPGALAAVRSADDLSSRALLLLACGGMAWLEGHRGFAQRVVPRLDARLAWLAARPRGWRHLAAPFVAADLVGVPRAALLRRWLLVAAVVGMIGAGRLLPASARDVVHAAVWCGLAYGFVAIARSAVSQLRAPAAAARPAPPPPAGVAAPVA